MGNSPFGLFVDTNNSIYAPNRQLRYVSIWSSGSIDPVRNLSDNLTYPRGIFVTANGDVYVDNGEGNRGRVDKWTTHSIKSVIAMKAFSVCFGLFCGYL